MNKDDFLKGFTELSAEDQKTVLAKIAPPREAGCRGAGEMQQHMMAMMKMMESSEKPMECCQQMMGMCEELMHKSTESSPD